MADTAAVTLTGWNTRDSLDPAAAGDALWADPSTGMEPSPQGGDKALTAPVRGLQQHGSSTSLATLLKPVTKPTKSHIK